MSGPNSKILSQSPACNNNNMRPYMYKSYITCMLMYVQHQQLYVVLLTLDKMTAAKVDIYTCVYTSVTELLSVALQTSTIYAPSYINTHTIHIFYDALQTGWCVFLEGPRHQTSNDDCLEVRGLKWCPHF